MAQTLSELVSAVENDVIAAGKWLINEGETLVIDAATALLLPAFQAISPGLIADAEVVVVDLAKTAGVAAFDYLTGTAPGDLFTAFASRAEALGKTELATLEPVATSALLGLKALALRGLNDAESALGIGSTPAATSPAPAASGTPAGTPLTADPAVTD